VSSTVFAEESPPRSARFEAENGLHLFALTVPFVVDALGCLCSLRARSALDGVSWVQGG
jgi:hypothetical protein